MLQVTCSITLLEGPQLLIATGVPKGSSGCQMAGVVMLWVKCFVGVLCVSHSGSVVLALNVEDIGHAAAYCWALNGELVHSDAETPHQQS